MAYTDHHILRLMHFDNLEHILKHGMYSKNSGHVILTAEQEERAKTIQQQTGTNIPIYVDNKRKYFYP